MMDIPYGTQNVILYCICTRNDSSNRPVAVGPIEWFINGSAITATTASGNNPYYRNNVPSPLIIPLFTDARAGTYGCGGLIATNTPITPSISIDLATSGMCNCTIFDASIPWCVL